MNHYQNLLNHLNKNQHTWLISGVAGFIGSHIAEQLLSHQQKVIGIDNLSSGSLKNLAHLSKHNPQPNNFSFVEMDIRSAEECKKIMKGVDYVLHHAAMVSVPHSIERPDLTNEVNITGFLNMLSAAIDEKVKRFVYASSSAVYGNVKTVPTNEEHVDTQLSPYGVSKFVNELYAKTMALCHQIETIGLRYFNVFGPRQDPNGAYAAVIPRWITALLNNQSVEIYGDGETSRDFCYVKNVVQANLLAATTQARPAINQVYNIATGQEISLNQLYELIINELALPKEKTKCEYKDFRPGDIRRSIANINKAQELLAYQPTHDLKSGLKEAMHWYRSA